MPEAVRPIDRAEAGELGDRLGETGIGIAVIDNEGVIDSVNAPFARLARVAPYGLRGKPLRELFDAESASNLLVHLPRMRAGELDLVTIRAELQRPDAPGMPVHAALVARREAAGALASMVMRVLPVERSLVLSPMASTELRWLRGRVAQLERTILRVQTTLEELSPIPSVTAPGRAERAHLEGLTVRELEIVQLLAEGLRPPSIARRMHLSQSTIRNHLSGIFRKTGVSSQEGLLRLLRDA